MVDIWNEAMLLYRSVLAPACMLNADALHVLSAAMVLPLQLKFDFNIQCRQLLTLRFTYCSISAKANLLLASKSRNSA